jgi:hypothetical protein
MALTPEGEGIAQHTIALWVVDPVISYPRPFRRGKGEGTPSRKFSKECLMSVRSSAVEMKIEGYRPEYR